MQLDFEIINSEVGSGNYPDLIHFANTQAQIFSITGGELYGVPTDKIDYGEWEGVVLQDESKASPDTGMSHFEVKVLPGWGIIGGYKTGNIHKMIIYEFAWEMGQYLNSGSIKYSNDPVSSFTLSLENPDENNPEHPGNVAVNEESSLLSPGAKVTFKFSAGDDIEEVEIGTFYVDRSNFTIASETASVDGRNLIGKALKDQTLDENSELWFDSLTNILSKILVNAGIERNYLIESTEKSNWFTFAPTASPFSAIQEILSMLQSWKMQEHNNEIIIGSTDYAGFPQNSIYTFYRNKDIFSRQITSDDAQSYTRVCIHTANYAFVVYRDVQARTGWNINAKKTMYVQVADGTRISEMELQAEELASRLENVGKVESFTGPFRPQLLCGDEAIIVSESGNKSLGLITEMAHNFGKSGFYTNFTVDSGGMIGKGRLSEYIAKIAAGSSGGSTQVGYEDVILGDYRNLALESTVTASSQGTEFRKPETIIDGITDLWSGWESWEKPWKDNAWIVINLGRKCKIDKIVYYHHDEGYGYKFSYWNSAFWVDLAEGTQGASFEETIEFDAIYTTKIRLAITNISYAAQVREIEIYGEG